MASELDFYQIYYREEQQKEFYPFAIPYYNEKLTDYFENSVISELVPKSDAKRISVCSWRLRAKRKGLFRVAEEIDYQSLIDDYDVAILTPRSPSHKPLFMANIWHGKAWTNAIAELRKFIKVPKELKHIIYENHFVADSSLYKSYVTDCLNPCIDFMSTRSVFFADANYVSRKSAQEVADFRAKTGRNDWAIAPFILERLFAIWINDKGFKVVNK